MTKQSLPDIFAVVMLPLRLLIFLHKLIVSAVYLYLVTFFIVHVHFKFG